MIEMERSVDTRSVLSRAVVPLGATVASALLLTLAFPPARVGALAWVALAPLFVAARSLRPASAFLLGLFWSEVFLFVVIDALPAAISGFFGSSLLVSWTSSAMVFAVNGGFYLGGALAVYSALAGRFRVLLPLLAAAAWAAAELGRGRLANHSDLILGTPMGLVAYTQTGWHAMTQIASITGPYGISFAIVAVNAALAEVWLGWRGRARLQPLLAGLGLALLPTVGALVFGYAVLPAEDVTDGGDVPIVVVQGNLDPGTRWEPEFYGKNLDSYLKLTLRSFEVVKTDIGFWPEAAMTFHLSSEEPFRKLIARVLTAADAELIAGGPRSGGGDLVVYHNSVFALSPAGEILGHYDKEYLLPFAEFPPLERLDFLPHPFGPYRFWEPGGRTPPLPTRAGPAGVLVCNEAMLPEVAARRVRDGAAFLVTPANDGWLDGSWTPWPKWGALMMDMTALRAVETRRWVVRASTSGPSGVIDPWGRRRATTQPGMAAVLLSTIRPRDDRTLYARFGDAFGLACGVVALGAVLVRRRPQRRPNG
jgi:apolipoprotein N-acyltransferase